MAKVLKSQMEGFCRGILVCRHLRGEDFEISHILEDGSLEDNHDTERRLMKLLKIPEQTLFDRPEELVERAYNEQGNRIAYTIKTESQEEMERGPPEPTTSTTITTMTSDNILTSVVCGLTFEFF